MEIPMKPTLIYIDGRAMWRFPDGKTLPFVAGGEGPLPDAPPAPNGTQPPAQQQPPGPQWQQTYTEGLPQNYQGRIFTEQDHFSAVEAARAQEREKLYRDREAERAELERLRVADEQRQAAEAQRQSEAAAAAEAAQRQREAEELDAKTLIERRQAEMEARLAAQQARFEEELARRDVIAEKEREYARLEVYRTQVVAQNADQILPELQDMVTGTTKQEIDESVARLVERSASVINNFRQATEGDPRDVQGVRPWAPAMGPEALLESQRQFSTEEMKNWSMKDYLKYRDQLPTGRAAGAQGDRGLFA